VKYTAQYNKKKITLKFSAGLFVFVLLAIFSNLLIERAIQKNEFDSVIINVAGLQRMLSQRYTREVNMALIGLASSDWKGLLKYKSESSRTEKKFEKQHNALINSGIIKVAGEDVYIPAIADPELRKELHSVFQAWNELKRSVVIAFRSDKVTIKNNINLQDIQDRSLEVFRHMDRSVNLLQHNSEKRLNNVNSYLSWILLAFFFTFIIVFIYVFKKVITPLEVMTSRALADSQVLLNKAQRASKVGHCIIDLAHNKIMGSDELLSIINVSNENFTLGSFIASIHLKDRETARELIKKGENADLELQLIKNNEHDRWVHLIIEATSDDENKISELLITIQDISERKKSENSLELSKNIIENAREAILVTDLNGVIEQVNDAYLNITGFSRDEVLGTNPRSLQSGYHDKMFYAEMWRDIYGTGHWEGEIWDRRKNGEAFPKWLSINTVYNDYGNPEKYVGIFTDITVLKETEKELEHLAYHDALTQLPNRALLLDRLKQGIYAAKRDGQNLAVLLIDLDHFKYVNDTLGHDAGDELLENIAKRLQTFVRESDTVARLGGDEFVILLPEVNDPEEASIIAQKIIDALKEPIGVKGKKVNIGASIGIATYPNDGDDSELLMKHADLALYKAKDSGRGCYHYFSEELQEAIFDHIAMEEEMRKGIDSEQFTLHYQPKIDLASGKMTGMEALVRWNHPDKGFVRPDHFIPFAEETGLIIPLGLWILKTACRQMAEFNAGLKVPLKVAINLSAGQFNQRGLIYTIQEIIQQYDIKPENIELEITESSVMGDVNEAIATMNKFRDIGLHLAIDDFGTGYSSLSYLKRFPINTLKIDQSFIRDLTIDSDDSSIVKAIISMAKSLQLNVVAEGVETQEQLAFLKANNCENVQGYLFSKPLPADEFKQYINDNSEIT